MLIVAATCALFISPCGHICREKAAALGDKYKFVKTSKVYKKDIDGVQNCEKGEYELPDICFVYKNKIAYPEKNVLKTLKQIEVEKGGFKARVSAMNFAFKNGFTKKQAALYAFPEFKKPLELIEKDMFTGAKNAELSVIKNSAKITQKEEIMGSKMNENALFDDIFNKFNKISNKYKFEIKSEKISPEISLEDIKKISHLRGGYETSFASSGSSRKSNIKRAAASFDGIVLNPGESLSFNNTTGIRNEENGYSKAKIIKNGMFVSEFGGGVCQVSTTLYNAALLADLEIVEVHPHSLPVSYVEPCFDAMVSMGSSDLVILNNHDYPITIATSSADNKCTVKIYGQENPYKIVRNSEKISENEHFDTVYTSDYELYGLSEPLYKGESRIITYGKPGYVAKSKLEYYEKGVLVKTKQLRKNTYLPTKQVVLEGCLALPSEEEIL